MDKKLKSENMQKIAVFMFMLYFESNQGRQCRERRYADHMFIRIYFRMHDFVVKFSNFSSPQAARGHRPPKQDPVDVPECKNASCVLLAQRISAPRACKRCLRLHGLIETWTTIHNTDCGDGDSL